MSASELFYWKDFFSVYPFSEDREDMRNAKLCWVVSSSNGGKIPIEKFLPNYLEEKYAEGKSLEQQDKEFSSFRDKYLEARQR